MQCSQFFLTTTKTPKRLLKQIKEHSEPKKLFFTWRASAFALGAPLDAHWVVSDLQVFAFTFESMRGLYFGPNKSSFFGPKEATIAFN
jgi:hypothetical protein